MNLDEWKQLSGAYMPKLEDRMDYAIEHLEPDPLWRVPAWAAAYILCKSIDRLKARYGGIA